MQELQIPEVKERDSELRCSSLGALEEEHQSVSSAGSDNQVEGINRSSSAGQQSQVLHMWRGVKTMSNLLKNKIDVIDEKTEIIAEKEGEEGFTARLKA